MVTSCTCWSCLAMECIIRLAQIADCDRIMAMICEIAEHHNLLKEIKINAQVLRSDGFGSDPFYQCLLVELAPEQEGKQGNPISYTLFFFGYSVNTGCIVFLENLYVVSEFRSQGIRKKLLSEVAKVALAQGCREMKFMVAKWNSQALVWYWQLGAQDKMEAYGWHGFELEGEALCRLAGYSGPDQPLGIPQHGTGPRQ